MKQACSQNVVTHENHLMRVPSELKGSNYSRIKIAKRHNLIRINLLTWIIIAFTLSFSIQVNAQSESQNSLLQMIGDDRTTVDAIAGCDKKTQSHILQVAQTPELLNKIEELQKRSQNQFKAIIENYDRDTQAAFYDIARYPNLITDLVSNGKPSASEVDQIVLNYPQDVRETIIKYARSYFDVLLSIERLNNEIDRAFKYSLEPYDPQTRESVNALLGYPEIVSALVDDKVFTKLLGEIYRDDPDWVERRLDQISQELAEHNKDDLEAYKNQIQNDPEAYNEMLDASEKFSRENNEVRYLDNSNNPNVEVEVINSYPYWFGYPYWYSDPYWRPRPLYYHTGFYRNHLGNVVFVGLPSGFFLHWQSYYHPTLYPHLSYNYYSYYENHYMRRYQESPRTFPHHGFYRSIEANVINNPRVNNSRLERIDHQRGNNIVRQPNTMESKSPGRGSSVYTRQREISGSRQGPATGGSVNRRGTAPMNSGSSGGAVNRREYNRSEGSVNRRGSETGSAPVRREAAPASSTTRGTSAGRESAPAQRSSASQKRETPSAAARTSGRSARREAKVANRQSNNRRATREKGR